MDGTFKCTIPMIHKDKICNYVPLLETQNFYPVLNSVTNVGHNVPEVKILLGADVIETTNRNNGETRKAWLQRKLSSGGL
jgi:hypothetical protein